MPKPEIHKELDETLEDVRSRGWDVSRRQYRTWRGKRLVPAPSAQTGMGRGAGKYAYYPPRTADQVCELKWALDQRRSLSWARWYLWTRDYPVDEAIRHELIDSVQQLRSLLEKGLADFEAEKEDNPVRQAVEAERLSFGGWLRGRVGRSRMSSLVYVGLALSQGQLNPQELKDPNLGDVVGDALQASYQRYLPEVEEELAPTDFNSGLPEVFEALGRFNLPGLEREFQELSTQDLRTLRDRAKLLFRNWFPKEAEVIPAPVFLMLTVFLFDRFGIPLGELVAVCFAEDDPIATQIGKLLKFTAVTGELHRPEELP